MFSDFKEWIKDVFINRFTLLLVVYIVLIVILIQRLFIMQIVNGQDYLNNFKLTIKKETTLKSTRGSIYDRNGNLLAYNKLAYSVTIEDNFESGKKKNALINDSLSRAIKIIEDCGDSVDNDFNIYINDNGQYEFTISGTKLTRFLADIYGHKSTDDLTTAERNSSPDDVVMYLADSKKYGIGHTVIDTKGNSKFIPCEGYSKEEVLKIMTIRYEL